MNELEKLAYVKGSQQAMIDAGYTEKDAVDAAVDPVTGMTEEKLRAGPTIGGQVAAGLSPVLGGALAPQGMGWGTFGRSLGYGTLGGIGGAAGGLGLAALIAALTKGRLTPESFHRIANIGVMGGGIAGNIHGAKQTYKARLREALERGDL